MSKCVSLSTRANARLLQFVVCWPWLRLCVHSMQTRIQLIFDVINLQQSATSRMSRTKMEILSTYLRTQFIIMTLAAKHVHVIEVQQAAQTRPNVMSSLKFPARSSSLLPKENAVQHAVSSFD